MHDVVVFLAGVVTGLAIVLPPSVKLLVNLAIAKARPEPV